MGDSEQMVWATGLSERLDTESAMHEAAEAVALGLGGAPDLLLIFATGNHAGAFGKIPGWAHSIFSEANLLGCSASGAIAAGREVEHTEAVALVGARLPGVDIHPLAFRGLPSSLDAQGWRDDLGLDDDSDPSFILLADPFVFDTEGLLQGLDDAYPGAPKVGGLASGGQGPAECSLFVNDGAFQSGAAGVALTGRIRVETVVAQGCRPIGEPLIITRSRDGVVYELDQGRPVDVLQRLYSGLDRRDQELFGHSLFVGIEMKKDSRQYAQGDFLIRNLIGMDPSRGAMAMGGQCKDYQVIQFHLRDARTSSDDLDLRLGELAGQATAKPYAGALLFSCTGRGEALYGTPNHDSDAFCGKLGAIPLGGFFGEGEIGPVAGKTFLHGYTSAFAVFREP